MQIAIYMRLSKEDAHSKQESSSISNQRRLLLSYAATHFPEYEVTEFADDGYSGTNLQRPGVQAMLEQAKNSKLECILVKDFSRFSRDYIELGTYLERIFPMQGVRFVSVNDGYDSGDAFFPQDAFSVALKGLLYDLYSKDLSVKVKASLKARHENGEYVGANCPFGYCRMPGDRHGLRVKEDEAAVVREIFNLAMRGFSARQIAEELWKKGVGTPAQFRKESSSQENTACGKLRWQPAVICRILKNPVYVGDMVYGKTECCTVGGKNYLRPRAEWRIYPKHHAPIIDRETFEAAQHS